MGPDDLEDCAGMVVLAMGKMGAHELNYSSDIDLICLFDESRFDADDYHDARASFIRATRKLAAMLHDITGDGYGFRTDLRLRHERAGTPGGRAMGGGAPYDGRLGGGGNGFVQNKEMLQLGFIGAGTVNREKVEATKSLYERIMPSAERDLALNKADKASVD